MSSATPPSNNRRRRERGIATLRRLKQDIISTFSKNTAATSIPTCSKLESSIYTERLLSGNQTRVLHIQPSSDPHQQLKCKLTLVNLNDRPSYEALSYVWGVEPPSVWIVCNDQPLAIRPELSYALTRLRLKRKTRIVWADALCINQNDIKEKSHQVPLMSKIYSQATKVNIWLGHGDESVIKVAFDCSRYIASVCRDFSLKYGTNLRSNEALESADISTTIFTPKVCQSLSTLFTRPLFKRVWCIQEILLAEHPVVTWGEQELPWADVGLAALWIFCKRTWYDVAHDLRDSLSKIHLGEVHNVYTTDPYEESLLDLLRRFGNSQSTDPRDKVYGLISLVETRAEGVALIPDYEKSVGRVFADTVICTLSLTRQLEALTYVEHHGEYDGDNQFRSWAPRWDLPQIAFRLCAPWMVMSNNACGGRIVGPLAMQDSERCKLRLTGVIHATTSIVKLLSGFDYFENEDSGEQNPVTEIYESIGSSDGNRDEKLRAVARTFTAGRCHSTSLVEEVGEEALSNFYKSFEDLIEWLRASPAELNGLSDNAHRYRYTAEGFCYQRCFFWTQERDFGLGPECMRAGDIVVVLYGGHTPFVLRPKGDKYLFLGEAYVDSIMHGELMKEVEEENRQEQEFCLI